MGCIAKTKAVPGVDGVEVFFTVAGSSDGNALH